MTIIRFVQPYSSTTRYNPGEEATFTDIEATALIHAGAAVLVRKVVSAVPDPYRSPFVIRKGGQS